MASVAPAEISVPDKPVTVIVSKNGWVRARQGHSIDASAIGYKTGDFGFAVIETRTVWPLIVIDTNGRAYTVKVAELPAGAATARRSYLRRLPGRRQASRVVSDTPEASYVSPTLAATASSAASRDATSRQRPSKAFMTLERAKVLSPGKVHGDWVVAASEEQPHPGVPRPELRLSPAAAG